MRALSIAALNVFTLRRRLLGQVVLITLSVALCTTAFGVADNAESVSNRGILESVANRSITVDRTIDRQGAPILSDSAVTRFRNLAGVQSVEPSTKVSFGYKGAGVAGVLLYATSARPSLLPPITDSTRSAVFPLASREVVLPAIAEGSDLSALLGKRLTVQTVSQTGASNGIGSSDTVTVVGLFDPKWQIDGPAAAYLDQASVIRWSALAAGVPQSRYTSQIGYNAVTVVAATSQEVPRLLGVIQSEGFSAMALQQQLKALPALLGLVRTASRALLVVLALVALVGTLTVSGALVRQRTREIGILKATGFSNRSIFTTFVAEAMLTATVAVMTGLVLGAFGAWLLRMLLRRSADLSDYLGSGWPFPNASTVLLISAVSLAVVALGALLPSGRAARMDPLTAMRDW
ncbi:MAG: putative transport system permease protein [Pseudonocardiales bacterium]|nr:putative transport system permease protein [Pseudonocardiales bacterium]